MGQKIKMVEGDGVWDLEVYGLIGGDGKRWATSIPLPEEDPPPGRKTSVTEKQAVSQIQKMFPDATITVSRASEKEKDTGFSL